MRNYMIPVLIFLLIFIGLLVIVRYNNPPISDVSSSPTPTATLSATLAPSPSTVPQNRTIQPVPVIQSTPVIIRETQQQTTIREVPQNNPQPQPTSAPAPQPTPQPNPTPEPTTNPNIVCVLGVCL